MSLSLRRDNSAVASTVATMLSLLVILLFMTIAIVDIVPRQQSDAEFVTTQAALSSFQQIRGFAQGPMVAGSPDQIFPATTVAIPLGTQGVSPLQPQTTGTLTFNAAAVGSGVHFQFVPHFNSAQVSHVDQDIVLAIDSSGSMNQNDPQRLRISGAKEYIGRLSCPDHVAIVDFDSDAHLTKANVGGPQHHLTTASHNCFPNFDEAKTDVDTIDAAGSTNSGMALLISVNELLGYGDSRRARVIILLTDGVNTSCLPVPPCSANTGAASDALAKRQALRARDRGIVIYTIGLGPEMDLANPRCPSPGQVRDCLREIADITGGSYYDAPTAASIRWIYFEISRHFIGAFACGDLTTAEVGQGTLSLNLRNMEYPAQTITYEAGGIVRRQPDGTRVIEGPALEWTPSVSIGAVGTLNLNLVALSGSDFIVEGSDTQILSFRPVGRDLEEIAIVKTNLTDVIGKLTKEKQNLDYWETQGAISKAARDAVKANITSAQTALGNAQSKADSGDLTGAKFAVDSATAQLSAAIATAQGHVAGGGIQQWLADATADSILIKGCHLTQWVNWYEGVTIEVSSVDAAAWSDWLDRTASATPMQFISSRVGDTAMLTIRAVDMLIIERRIVSVSLST